MFQLLARNTSNITCEVWFEELYIPPQIALDTEMEIVNLLKLPTCAYDIQELAPYFTDLPSLVL